MRDIDIIMKAMHDAQALLGAYIEPGPRDPEAVVQSMLEILDREDVICTGPVDQTLWTPESCTIT